LFATYRYHAVFTDSLFPLGQAESNHRGNAIVEQVFADPIDGPWAHLPSTAFHANFSLAFAYRSKGEKISARSVIAVVLPTCFPVKEKVSNSIFSVSGGTPSSSSTAIC